MRVALLCCCLFTVFSVTTIAQSPGWRGIVPLRSTRADVERLLGEGKGWDKGSYYLKDGNVFFLYSSKDCESGGSGGWAVPPTTVLHITVYPKRHPKLSELHLDESKFEKQPNISSRVYYVNKDEGLMLDVDEKDGEVEGIYYGPTAADEARRCPGYDRISYDPEIPKPLRASLLETLSKFVEYQRTAEYEKQYEMYLTEFAVRMLGKNKEEFADLMRHSNGASRVFANLTEFKPKSISIIEDDQYGKIYDVFGLATTLEEGRFVESYRRTKLVLKGGKWYFVDLFNLIPL